MNLNDPMIESLQSRSKPASRRVPKLFTNRLFLFTTFIPTLIASLYFGLIASDVYISESRFVVRSPERQTASPLGLMFKSAGFTRASDDTYAVQDFILSRDALKALDGELKIKDAFSSSDIDLFSRFGALSWDKSLEAFHLYYQKKISIQLDPTSSITTLTTRAYSPEQALAMNQRLVELAEELVNNVNTRGRQDMIRFASEEVADAATAAGLALARYRDSQGVIDPEKQATLSLQQAAKLQEELVSTRSQLAQLERLASSSPQLPVLRQRVQLIEKELQAENSRVAGGKRSLADKTAEYHRLALEKEFADKLLASAMNTMELARNEAQRQQLYLERVVQPSKPDEAMEPLRLRNVLAVFVLGLMAWGILAMLIVGIKDHQD
jgi:capsular polysaccharide transport system permease protein